MAALYPPLFSYIYSDPLVLVDASTSEVTDVESLDIEKEKQNIKSVADAAKCPVRWIARVATEQQFVTSYCDSEVFHFTGHGIDGSMAFEAETGELKFIGVAGLREMCQHLSRKPRLLFLSMCHGRAVGLEFAALGVDHVITVCNDRILDKASLLFADQFYRALLGGHSVRDSFEQGLARLQGSYPEEKAKYFLTGRSAEHKEVLFPCVDASLNAAAPGIVVDETPMLPTSTCNEVTSFFIGRRREVFHTYKNLVSKYRVICLTGPPGIGKSQVALACGAYCRDRYLFDMILHWEVIAPGDYMSQMFRAFELRPPAGDLCVEDAVDLLRGQWVGRNVLCIVDGIPSEVEASGFFRRLIDGLIKRLGTVSILTTSREPIPEINKVRVVAIGPLKDIDAAKLFVLRSPRSLSKGELTQFESHLVSENPEVSFSKSTIIQSLGGSPLVVERVAMETGELNLLQHRTEVTMNIIPRILCEVSGLGSPDPSMGLTRSMSERSPSRGGPSRRGASEVMQGSSIRSPGLLYQHSSISLTAERVHVSDVERRVTFAYANVLGKDRPLTRPELTYLTERLKYDSNLLVSRSDFDTFFTWYNKLLTCFSRSDLWRTPGCMHGFLNRSVASEMLLSIPTSSSKKGIFIIGISESEPCLVVSFVSDSNSVSPCKIYFDSEATDAPFSVRTKGPSGKNESISFDKLSSVIIHLPQLLTFYPDTNKFEKLGMREC